MAEDKTRYSPRTLKRIILLLSVIVLINPFILYLVSGNMALSILLPAGVLSVFLPLYESRKLKPLGILFFNLIIVLGFFLHAEAIFTYRFGEYIIEDLYEIKGKYYFNRPYLNQTFRDKEFTVQYKTNGQGFRIGAEDEPDAEVQRADWLFIGDSYTQGAQVQYEELYTGRLFDLFPDKIMVNAGISGMGIADEYHYYINEGKNLNAEKVFLQICNFNDFMNVKERRWGFSDYLMQYSHFARYVLYGFKYANPAELPLGRWTEPFYPDQKSNEDFNVFYKIQSEQKKRDLENFRGFLKKFNEAVKREGAELIVVQIPTKEQVYYTYFDEVVSGFGIDVAKLDMDFPNRYLARLCNEYGIGHLDLLNDFTDSENELFYSFDEHLNASGHEQTAKSIARFLSGGHVAANRVTVLGTSNAGDRYPNFSARNRNLSAYQSQRDGNTELFLADSLMAHPRRLTWNQTDELHPWLSPDGKRIVFTEGDQSENRTRVVLMNTDGTERRYITKEAGTYGAIPSFSHDGSKIAYAEWKSGPDGHMSNPYIVICDPAADKKTAITSDRFEHWRPIFTPNGDKLIFISKENGDRFDIFEYSLSTGEKRNLTASDHEEWDPAVSPDGKKMAYAARKDGNWDLFLYEFETNSHTRLTQTRGNEWDPAFSPCGNYIYYAGTFGLRNGIFRRPIH